MPRAKKPPVIVLTPAEAKAKQAALRLKSNPLAFAEYYLRNPDSPEKPFKARWLQTMMLGQCMHRLNTVRAQRGCGKTISLMARILWFAYTHGHSRILCIGPYKITIQRIFEELNKQIDCAPELAASLAGRRNNPFEIKFDNGAIIRGQSTNVTSKKGGQSVRGEHPHFIYIDEADYLDDADWKSFIPLITPSEPDVDPPEVWATTTPTGKRSYFYELCEQKGPGSKGFYWKDWWFPARHILGITLTKNAPYHINKFNLIEPDNPADSLCSMVNPTWDKERDDMQWAQLGEQGYYHEFAAWWGDSTASVFPKRLVDNAKKLATKLGFNYIQKREQGNGGFFTAGVDVDEMSATPNICIVEYIPNPASHGGTGGGTYLIRNRYAIPRSDTIYSDLEREMILQSNNFRLDRAYVDKQPGAHTVELLRLAGYYNFEGKSFKENVDIPTADAEGHIMLEKKPMKHAMIFLVRRLFEQGRIALLPIAHDPTDTATFSPFGEVIHVKEPTWDEVLETVIRNYQVINVTKLGVPEYTGVKDHPLMAMLLALFAAYEMYDDPFSISMPNEVIISKTEDVPLFGAPPVPLPGETVTVAKPVNTSDPAAYGQQSLSAFTNFARMKYGDNTGRAFTGTKRSSF